MTTLVSLEYENYETVIDESLEPDAQTTKSAFAKSLMGNLAKQFCLKHLKAKFRFDVWPSVKSRS
ncbi:hypothetical protein ACTXT7_003558 [Hymenolepis weldensis]